MEFIFITNTPDTARVAQAAEVDLIMVDLEINGKEARQGHLCTVISRHQPEDVTRLRAVLDTTQLLVRINPIFDGSTAEIDDVIARGADQLMLPMFTSAAEVAQFVSLVDGRARTCLLLETPAALARINEILAVEGIDHVHLGLNDLHLGLGLDFMFEILSGGLAEYAAQALNDSGIPFGIGGVARLGTGLLSADLILSEHIRLGSQRVILSRDFHQIFGAADTVEAATEVMRHEIDKLRAFLARDDHDLSGNRVRMHDIVQQIVTQKVQGR